MASNKTAMPFGAFTHSNWRSADLVHNIYIRCYSRSSFMPGIQDGRNGILMDTLKVQEGRIIGLRTPTYIE